MADRKKQYMLIAKKNIARIMSIQDKKDHGTRGSFYHPGWKQKKGFANARWQEAVCSLAHWHESGRPKDKKYRASLKKAVTQGIDYAFGLQHRNGSFPENFSSEKSYAATAFLTGAVAEALMVMGKELPASKEWTQGLRKAGQYLIKNRDSVRTNIEAAASLSLSRLYRITKDKKFLNASESKLDYVLKRQSKEGFFYEKRGMDLSYSSIVLGALAEHHHYLRKKRLLDSAGRYISLLRTFIYPDGTFGGKYNTRTAGWLDLSGLEYFAQWFPEAEEMLRRLAEAHKKGLCDMSHTPNDRHVCTDTIRLLKAASNHKKRKQKKINKTGLKAGPKTGQALKGGASIIHKKDYIAVTDSRNSALHSLWTSSGIKILCSERDLSPKKNLGIAEKAIGFLGTAKLQWLAILKIIIIKLLNKKRGRIFFGERSIRIIGKKSIVICFSKGSHSIKKGMAEISSPGEAMAVISRNMESEYLGKIPVNTSMFFGEASMHFLLLRFPAKKASIEIAPGSKNGRNNQ